MRLRREPLTEPAGALRRVRARYDIMCFNFQALRRVLLQDLPGAWTRDGP